LWSVVLRFREEWQGTPLHTIAFIAERFSGNVEMHYILATEIKTIVMG
jgi:hypothetical protein